MSGRRNASIRAATLPHTRIIVVIVLAIVLAVGIAMAIWQFSGDDSSVASGLPPNDPRSGLIYDDLEPMRTDGPCAGLYTFKDTGECTHGPDPAPKGVNALVNAPPIPPNGGVALGSPSKVQCDGDGISGKRVQVIYARPNNATDRYKDYVNSLRQWAAEADRFIRVAAAETRGERHIRFVHDANCVLAIPNVTVAPDQPVSGQLIALGYDSVSRVYLVFADEPGSCTAGVPQDDSSDSGNVSNSGPYFARLSQWCWGLHDSAIHELMHAFGAVQKSAPHATARSHCWDEWDLMCYDDDDDPSTFPLDFPCPPTGYLDGGLRLDCNHDDYFSTSPAASSYLATHWNVANSQFLASEPQPLWGYVLANAPLAATYSPSVQRNSTGAKNLVTRTSVGRYTVTFTNLGIYWGGTANVTARGTGSESCNTAGWTPLVADMTVAVRCYTAAGNPVDTSFAASFTRPTSSFYYGYILWGGGTPNSGSYQFNSTGATNTVERTGLGSYVVTLPGLGTGGTVKVTARSFTNTSCKVGSSLSVGTSFARVGVICQTPAGAHADSAFTITFHRAAGLLGTGTSRHRVGYVWADQPTAASYVPKASYSFNSAFGGTSISRSGTGTYQVKFRGLGTSRGHVQVTAYGSDDTARCKVAGWTRSGSDELVDVRCFNAAGTLVNARYVVDFVD